MTQRKNITGGQPSILALKNIIAKTRDEICMRTLTVAIRQHCLEQHQIHLKDHYLKFFLQCEGKLKKNSSIEWQKTINNQIKKIVGAEKIFAFVHLKLYRDGFNKIEIYAQMDDRTKIQEKIYEEFEDLRDLQISEEVKTKTKFFFVWCQFLAEKKSIKKLKNKEIEDLKKSKTFNQYTIRFNAFIQWKQYVRRINIAKQKAKKLQSKTKNNKLAEIFRQIKQKIQIISIEKMLEEAVVNKLQYIGLKNVFNKLRSNKQTQTIIKSCVRKYNNIWLYRFYGYVTQRGTTLMNKSSVNARQRHNLQYQQLCKRLCWKGLKLQVQSRDQKSKKIKQYLKHSNEQKLIQILKHKKQIHIKNNKFQASYKKYAFNMFCASIQENSDNQQFMLEKVKKIKMIIFKNYMQFIRKELRSLVYHKRDLKSKSNFFQIKLSFLSKNLFIRSLRMAKTKKKDTIERITKIRYNNAMNGFRQRFNSYRQWKKSDTNIKASLAQKHQNFILKIAFKGFRSFKNIKAGQLDVFNSVYKLLDSKIKFDIFCCLKQRSIQMKRIQKLVQKCQYIALKVSFITILNRMLSKKMKIKSFCGKQDLQLKRKLFNMLLANSEHLSASTNKANEIYIRLSKKELMNKLKNSLAQRLKQQKANSMLQSKRKQLLFILMKQKVNTHNQQEWAMQNTVLMIKSARFQQFSVSAQEFISYREQQTRKMVKVQKNIKKSFLKSMRMFLKNKKSKYIADKQLSQSHNELIKRIQTNKAMTSLQSLLRQTNSSINNKFQQLYIKKAQQFIKFLRFKYNNQILNQTIKQSRGTQIINTLHLNAELRHRSKRLKGFITQSKAIQSLKVMNQNISSQKNQRQVKERELFTYLNKNRQYSSKVSFVQRLKNHHQLKQNSQQLTNYIVTEGFKKFIQSYFSLKQEELREYLALKHYAINVKRRGLRGLKYSMNVSLLKQNRTKTENNSKMIMQKSMDNARKKSKLLETIERYNLSRVSRIIR